MSNKKELDLFFNDKYEILVGFSYKMRKIIITQDASQDVLNDLYLYLSIPKNWNRIKDQISMGKIKDLMSFSVSYLKNQYNWKRTNTNKLYTKTTSEIPSNFDEAESFSKTNDLYSDEETPNERAVRDFKEERDLEKIKESINLLSDRERQIVNLYFFKNKRNIDISRMLKIPSSSVSTILSRSIAKIKRVSL